MIKFVTGGLNSRLTYPGIEKDASKISGGKFCQFYNEGKEIKIGISNGIAPCGVFLESVNERESIYTGLRPLVTLDRGIYQTDTYDYLQPYSFNCKLYVNGEGILTSQKIFDHQTSVGMCIVPPSAENTSIEFLLAIESYGISKETIDSYEKSLETREPNLKKITAEVLEARKLRGEELYTVGSINLERQQHQMDERLLVTETAPEDLITNQEKISYREAVRAFKQLAADLPYEDGSVDFYPEVNGEKLDFRYLFTDGDVTGITHDFQDLQHTYNGSDVEIESIVCTTLDEFLENCFLLSVGAEDIIKADEPKRLSLGFAFGYPDGTGKSLTFRLRSFKRTVNNEGNQLLTKLLHSKDAEEFTACLKESELFKNRYPVPANNESSDDVSWKVAAGALVAAGIVGAITNQSNTITQVIENTFQQEMQV